MTVDQTFDAESGCHIRPDAELVLSPCFRVVPMGRIGHCFCSMRLWSVLLLRTPHGMMGSCVRRNRCLNLQTTELSLAFTLDNITVLGRKHDDVSLRCDALQKMKLSASLVWITWRSLDAPLIVTVEVENSATSGYALMSCQPEVSIIQCAIAVQEKWRFIPLPKELKKHAANQDLEGFTSSLEDMFERPPGNVDAFVPAALSTECASFVLDAFRENLTWKPAQ